jgi:hypothetical protein
MASRNDVDVEFNSSPRVAEVASPSTEIIMQDLVDTMRDAEYSWTGMTAKKLINASGKEDLGGGVKVGITVALQDLKLAFEGRTVPAQVGTVSTNPGSAIQGRDAFTDSSATFITNGVARGSLVVNFTDQSVAEVVSVDSETQLTTKTLTEGIGNTYDVNDTYKVWNIVQVSATGGNLVGVDPSQVTVPAILPTAFTQVVVTSSASATLAEQTDIQYASFGGRVHLDENGEHPNTTAGTTFPTGTPRQPSSNMADADAILDARGLGGFFIHGNLTLNYTAKVLDHIFEGEGMAHSQVMVMAATDVHDSEWRNLMLMGSLDGAAIFENVHFMNVTDVLGVARNSMFQGTVTLGGTVDSAHGSTFHMLNCMSAIAGPGSPVIDFNGKGYGLSCRGYNGGIRLQNKHGPEDISIDLNSGTVHIDSSVTAGTIVVRGVGIVNNNSTGSTVVIDETIKGSDIALLRKLMQNRMETDPVTGIMVVYDDDGTTVLLQGKIYEDVLATQIYRGRGIERRDNLELRYQIFGPEFAAEFDQ